MKSFNEYVGQRDLDEGWFGNMASKAGNLASGMASKAGRYLGNVANSMVGSNIKVRSRGQQQQEPQQQPQKVGFNSADLLRVKESMRDYIGLLSRYIRHVIDKSNKQAPHSGTSIRYAYDQSGVQDAYTKLQKWYKWIDDMTGQARNEWVIEEGIKVNYRHFEQIQKDMQQMVAAMRSWVGQFPKLVKPELAQELKSVYDQNVVLKQGDLAKNFLWLNQKVQQFMQSRGVNYQGVETGASNPTAATPNVPNPKQQPVNTAGDDQAYGQKLYGGMASQANDARAINTANQQRYGQRLLKGINSQRGY